MTDDRLLTVHEVAARLGAHIETVRRWIRSGDLPAMRPGGRRLGYRVAESDLEQFLKGKKLAA